MSRSPPVPATWTPTLDEDEGAMWLVWLVRLRWVAIVAQVITLAFSFSLLDQPGLVLPLLLGVITVLVLANVWAMRRLAADPLIPEHTLLTHLIFDVAALTTVFMLAGGPGNSFTMLYLIHVAMGAVMLSPGRAASLAAVVLASYVLLHVYHLPLHLDRHSLEPGALLRLGQLSSFIITTCAVAVFVVGLANSLRSQKQHLLEARDRTARTDRLRSVGTLAAGAAHELNTPLSTVGLRLRRIARRHTDSDTVRDLEVMRAQLDRCKQIVDQLLFGAGDPSAADIERRPLAEMVEEGVSMWLKGSSIDVLIDDRSNGAVVELPRIAFVQALINLLENARQAQEEVHLFSPLQVRIYRDGHHAGVEVEDRGVGLPEAHEQVGEPFFTTKATGTGLGVFVARAVADGAGGGLIYRSGETQGTIAQWWFPVASPFGRPPEAAELPAAPPPGLMENLK